MDDIQDYFFTLRYHRKLKRLILKCNCYYYDAPDDDVCYPGVPYCQYSGDDFNTWCTNCKRRSKLKAIKGKTYSKLNRCYIRIMKDRGFKP